MTAYANCANPDCGRQFKPFRSTAKFCSAKCRAAAARERDTASEPTPVTTAAYRTRPVQGAGKHEGHMIHPHTHPVLDAGAHKGERKPCSGRYWCTDCSEWFSAPPCHGTVPPLLARLQVPRPG